MNDIKNTTESEIKNGKPVETTRKKNETKMDSLGIKISRGKYDSLVIYEITDSELDTLEKGTPTGIYLNFSIFLLSLAISFLITLLTIELEYNSIQFVLFTIICVAGFIIGGFLFLLWYRDKNSVNELCEKIRERLRR